MNERYFFCDNYSLLHFNKFRSAREPVVWKEVYVEMNRGDYKCHGWDLGESVSFGSFQKHWLTSVVKIQEISS